MNFTVKPFTTAIGLILVFSCGTAAFKNIAAGTEQSSLIKNAGWLIGEWENKTARRTSYESWSVKNDSVYSGKSYFLKEKDTVIMENISLEQHGKDLFYIPLVNGQNNNEPVSFKMVSVSSTQLVFENPAHDFPQMISYTQVTKDSLVAEISGVINGQERSKKFPMRRVK